MITAEHSPESMTEYIRLCNYRPHPDTKTNSNHTTNPNPTIPRPELLTIYDDSSQNDKSRCPHIFTCSAESHLSITNNGRYYKNVRKEWASLVAVPPSAKFHDALAFTRSLGDFHLHTYGKSILIIINYIVELLYNDDV